MFAKLLSSAQINSRSSSLCLQKTCVIFNQVYNSQNADTETPNTSDNDKKEYLLEPVHIQEALKLSPALGGISQELWRRSHETFTNRGINTVSFLQIVVGNPAVLTRHPSKIIQCFEFWRGCQFGEKLLHLLLTKYPELFDVNDEHRLLTHVGFLKSYVGTNKNVWKLLMNSPDLMEQTEQRIVEKFEYIKKNMHIDIPEIIKSAALSKPLEDIRSRHVFLERLNLFKPRPLKSNPDEPTKNNRLYQITDTSEKTFATKICHVSLDEYEVFQELYKRELERKHSDDSDEDEEDSDDISNRA